MMVPLAAPRIAIVDDHKGLRDAIAALLESAGYQASSFASAEAFLGSAQARRCSCLVLDDRLAGMRGIELQRVLGGGGYCPPIVFISAHEDDGAGTPARALERGAIAFLRKPFDDKEFLGAVRRALCATSSIALQTKVQ
jgi:FixJ family two-component response regulator